MSISRFAEAMTIFAVMCAAVFPVFHTGRPWLAAYWLFPYPNSMNIWPNFRSPLIWDVFAVSTYATVSVLFWYVGLIPDLATMRDRAQAAVGEALLRGAVARLARVGHALAALRNRVAAAGGPGDAAGPLGPHGRELRLRGGDRAGLAHDDLPAVLRRRRHLLRLRDGAHARHSHPRVLRDGRLHHDAAHPELCQGHAVHRPHRALRLLGRGVHGLVQRQPVRRLHDLRTG